MSQFRFRIKRVVHDHHTPQLEHGIGGDNHLGHVREYNGHLVSLL